MQKLTLGTLDGDPVAIGVPAAGTRLDPFGILFFDLGAPLTVMGLGTIPTSAALTIPPTVVGPVVNFTGLTRFQWDAKGGSDRMVIDQSALATFLVFDVVNLDSEHTHGMKDCVVVTVVAGTVAKLFENRRKRFGPFGRSHFHGGNDRSAIARGTGR